MTGWVLTMVLFGGLVTFTDTKPFPTEALCKEEGRRQMVWYRTDHIQASYECEQVQIKDGVEL
jgi:hypothetical protein